MSYERKATVYRGTAVTAVLGKKNIFVVLRSLALVVVGWSRCLQLFERVRRRQVLQGMAQLAVLCDPWLRR